MKIYEETNLVTKAKFLVVYTKPLENSKRLIESEKIFGYRSRELTILDLYINKQELLTMLEIKVEDL